MTEPAAENVCPGCGQLLGSDAVVCAQCGFDRRNQVAPGPDLGVEIDEQLLEKMSRLPQAYTWPGARLRDGSIADY
jgi:hypothetical protein